MKPSEAKEVLSLLWFIMACVQAMAARGSQIEMLLDLGAVLSTFIGCCYVWLSWKYAKIERAFVAELISRGGK